MNRTSILTAAALLNGGLWAQNWSLHDDPQGFQMRLPQGWRAASSADRRIRVMSANGEASVLIVPFVQSGSSCGNAAQHYLQNEYRGFVAGAYTQRRQSPDEGVLSFSFSNGRYRGTALCSIYRGSGMIFSIAAPATTFDVQKQDLVRIASSFSVSGGAGAPAQAAPQIRYVNWSDPAEGAFSMQVPAGWRVDGGIKRRSAVDVVGGVRMQSPDGAAFVFINDTELVSCVGPEAFAGFAYNNYREGQVYRSEYGTVLLMLRYQPGVRFAEMYIQMRLASMARVANPQIVDRRARTDLNQMAARAGNPGTDVGEVSFQAASGDQRGYIMAATYRGAGGIWSAGVLGYVAPSNRTGEAFQVFTHALQTMQGNQQWKQGQGRLTGEVSGIVSRTANDISQIMSGSYWSTQGSYAQIMQGGSDARRDQVRLQDPNTGETFVAAAGKNYYWRPAGADERGVFGTNNTDRPNIDATQLLQVP